MSGVGRVGVLRHTQVGKNTLTLRDFMCRGGSVKISGPWPFDVAARHRHQIIGDAVRDHPYGFLNPRPSSLALSTQMLPSRLMRAASRDSSTCSSRDSKLGSRFFQ
ncbi:MAG: hypothetical protein WA728_01750 [Xanthobacteraceae bacterium]